MDEKLFEKLHGQNAVKYVRKIIIVERWLQCSQKLTAINSWWGWSCEWGKGCPWPNGRCSQSGHLSALCERAPSSNLVSQDWAVQSPGPQQCTKTSEGDPSWKSIFISELQFFREMESQTTALLSLALLHAQRLNQLWAWNILPLQTADNMDLKLNFWIQLHIVETFTVNTLFFSKEGLQSWPFSGLLFMPSLTATSQILALRSLNYLRMKTLNLRPCVPWTQSFHLWNCWRCRFL